MIKQAPRPLQIVAMVAFVMSCVGVLLYLWLSFGGVIPLKSQGYQFKVRFQEATQLAEQADVRISGVPVGKVVKIDLGPGNTAHVQRECDILHHAHVREQGVVLEHDPPVALVGR